jgi:hypothetical protein
VVFRAALPLEGPIYARSSVTLAPRFFTPSGGFISQFGSAELNHPVGVAVGSDSGGIHVANLDDDQVDEFGSSCSSRQPFQEARRSSTVNGVSVLVRTQVWPWRSQVTITRLRAVNARSRVPSRTALCVLAPAAIGAPQTIV